MSGRIVRAYRAVGPDGDDLVGPRIDDDGAYGSFSA
jgi:hypothetical protein